MIDTPEVTIDLAAAPQVSVDVDSVDVEVSSPEGTVEVFVQSPLASIGVPGQTGPQGPPGANSTVPGPPGPPGPEGLNVLGAWSPMVTYHPDDLVTRSGSSWLATGTSTGVDPGQDVSTNAVASFTPTSPLALGSPTAVSMGFTVDRATSVIALNIGASWAGTPGGTVGIASAINVPGVGIQWLGKGPVQAGGRVDLDATVDLSVGVTYWLTMQMHAANIQIDQFGDLTSSHLTWTGFWYGSSEPSNDFGIYGLGVIFFGSTSDSAWQLFTAKGEPGSGHVRATTAVTTATLAAGALESGTITLAAAYRLFTIVTSRPARVRLYTTTAKRDADAARPVGTDPTGDHGMIFEFVSASGLLSADLSPAVDGYLPTGTAVPYTITNRDSAAGTVTCSFVWLREE